MRRKKKTAAELYDEAKRALQRLSRLRRRRLIEEFQPQPLPLDLEDLSGFLVDPAQIEWDMPDILGDGLPEIFADEIIIES